MKKITLSVVSFTSMLIIAYLLPLISARAAWKWGTKGWPIFFLLFAFSILVLVIQLSLGYVGATSLNLRNRHAIFSSVILCLCGLTWSALGMRSVVTSGVFFKDYCQGLSDRIKSKVDVGSFRNSLADLVERQNSYHMEAVKVEPESPINVIFPNKLPMVTAHKNASAANSRVSIYWRTSGGVIGIVYANSPPEKRYWFENSVNLGDNIWAVIRGE